MMTRRGGLNVKYISVVVVFFLCLYGFYCFHNVYTRLKNAEEKTTRLGQQHDSVSAQLQVVYEHKNRLEKSLQQEKTDHQRTKDEMKEQVAELDTKHQNDKNELMGRIDSINQENKMLQMKVDDQELENTKLKEELSNLQHDAEKRDTMHNEEYLQFKQEKEFEVGQLKDEVSNIARKKQDLQYQLEAALKGQQLHQQQFQQEQVYNLQLQDAIQNLKGQLQNHLPVQQMGQQQPQQFAHQQQNNYQGQQQQPNLLGQGQMNYQPQQALQGQQVAMANQQQGQQNVLQFNQNQQQFGVHQVADHADSLPNMNAGQNLANPQAQDDSMQIIKPGEKKSYFEPKIQDDNLEHKLAAEAKHQEDNMNDGGKVVQEQVIPPKLQENNNAKFEENVLYRRDPGPDEVKEHHDDRFGENNFGGVNEDHLQNRYEGKRNEDMEVDNFNNNRYREDNDADDREDHDNFGGIKPDDLANAGHQNQVQFEGLNPRPQDGGGINADNPLDQELVKAPNGLEINPLNNPLNNPFKEAGADQPAANIDADMHQNDFGGLNLNDHDNNKAMEEGVDHNNNNQLGALDSNQDKALERADFDGDRHGEAAFPLDRLDGEQRDQAADRPPMIGQGLRGGLPQDQEKAAPMFGGDRQPQELAPDGFGQQ